MLYAKSAVGVEIKLPVSDSNKGQRVIPNSILQRMKMGIAGAGTMLALHAPGIVLVTQSSGLRVPAAQIILPSMRNPDGPKASDFPSHQFKKTGTRQVYESRCRC